MGKWQEFVDFFGPNRIKSNERAKLYVEVERVDDLIKIVRKARFYKIPLYVIGGGSFVKIPDVQIEGLLIKNNCRKFDVYALSGKMREGKLGIDHKLVYAESGTNVNQLVRFTIEEGLSGLEYYLGLPGTIGGAISTNARYTPKSFYINDIVERIRILNTEGEIEEVGSEVIIKEARNDFVETRNVILSAIFKVIPDEKKVLWERAHEASGYREKLNKYVAELGRIS